VTFASVITTDVDMFCSANETGRTPECNLMSFITTLLYSTVYTSVNFPEIIYDLLDLTQRYQAQYGSAWFSYLNKDAYLASFGTATDENYDGMFDFCGFECSMIAIVTSDDTNYATSEYYYQLSNGSCTDTIFASTDWYNSLIISVVKLS
jgi:hypothetical protein